MTAFNHPPQANLTGSTLVLEDDRRYDNITEIVTLDATGHDLSVFGDGRFIFLNWGSYSVIAIIGTSFDYEDPAERFFTLTLVAYDDNEPPATDSLTFVVTVTNVVEPPWVEGSAGTLLSVRAGKGFTLSVSVSFDATHVPGEETIALVPAPGWLARAGTSISGTPGKAEVGNHALKLRVVDSNTLTLDYPLTISVHPVLSIGVPAYVEEATVKTHFIATLSFSGTSITLAGDYRFSLFNNLDGFRTLVAHQHSFDYENPAERLFTLTIATHDEVGQPPTDSATIVVSVSNVIEAPWTVNGSNTLFTVRAGKELAWTLPVSFDASHRQGEESVSFLPDPGWLTANGLSISGMSGIDDVSMTNLTLRVVDSNTMTLDFRVKLSFHPVISVSEPIVLVDDRLTTYSVVDVSFFGSSISMQGDARFGLWNFGNPNQREVLAVNTVFDYEDPADRVLSLTMVAFNDSQPPLTESLTIAVQLSNVIERPWVEGSTGTLLSVRAGRGFTISVAVSFDATHVPGEETIALVPAPGWLARTGTSISGTPGHADVGTHALKLRVVDSNTLTLDFPLTIAVYPVLSAGVASITVDEHQVTVATVHVSPAIDRTEIHTVSIHDALGFVEMVSLDARRYELRTRSGKSLDLEGAFGKAAAPNRYFTLEVTALDASLAQVGSRLLLTVSVQNIGEPPRYRGTYGVVTVAQAVKLSLLPDDPPIIFDVDSDPDGRHINYSGHPQPFGIRRTDGMITKRLFNPATEIVDPVLDSPPGTYHINLQVSDQFGSDSGNLTMVIVLNNMPTVRYLAQRTVTISEGTNPERKFLASVVVFDPDPNDFLASVQGRFDQQIEITPPVLDLPRKTIMFGIYLAAGANLNYETDINENGFYIWYNRIYDNKDPRGNEVFVRTFVSLANVVERPVLTGRFPPVSIIDNNFFDWELSTEYFEFDATREFFQYNYHRGTRNLTLIATRPITEPVANVRMRGTSVGVGSWSINVWDRDKENFSPTWLTRFAHSIRVYPDQPPAMAVLGGHVIDEQDGSGTAMARDTGFTISMMDFDPGEDGVISLDFFSQEFTVSMFDTGRPSVEFIAKVYLRESVALDFEADGDKLSTISIIGYDGNAYEGDVATPVQHITVALRNIHEPPLPTYPLTISIPLGATVSLSLDWQDAFLFDSASDEPGRRLTFEGTLPTGLSISERGLVTGRLTLQATHAVAYRGVDTIPGQQPLAGVPTIMAIKVQEAVFLDGLPVTISEQVGQDNPTGARLVVNELFIGSVTVQLAGDDRFSITRPSNDVIVKLGATLDYEREADRRVTLGITVDNGDGYLGTFSLTITVDNVREAPLQTSALVADEILAHNKLSVSLPDLFLFDADHSVGGGGFALGTLAPAWLTLAGANLVGSPPQAAAGRQTLPVVVNDSNALMSTVSLTVQVLPDRAPSLSVNMAVAGWPENTAGVPLGISVLALLDPDDIYDDALPTLSLAAGNPFELVEQALHVRSGEELDYEEASPRSWTVGLVAYDGNAPAALGLNTTLMVTVSLLNVNDNPPVYQVLRPQHVLAENTVHGTTGLSLSLSDADGPLPSLAWSSDVLSVSLVNDVGVHEIWFVHGHEPDYEASSLALLTLTLADAEEGQPTVVGTVTVSITDVNEAPTVVGRVSDQTVRVAVPYARRLSSFFADPDAGTTLTFSMATQPQDVGWLSINPNIGRLTGTPPNPGTVTVSVSAADGTLAVTTSFKLVVLPNSPPSLGLSGRQTFDLEEGLLSQATDTGHGYVVADVEDGLNDIMVTVSLLGDERISLDVSRQTVFIPAGMSFDYERAADRAMTLTILASDRAGATAQVEFTVTVANSVENPAATGALSVTVLAHNTLVTMIPSDLFVFDADHVAGEKTYVLNSPPAWLGLSNGTLTAMPLQAAAGNVAVPLLVIASGRSGETSVALEVKADRAPTLSVNTASATWPENSDDIALGISILGLADPDANLGDVAPTVSLVAGSPFTIVDHNLHVRPGEQQDYETAAQRAWAVGLVAVDGNAPAALGLNTTFTVTVSLTNLNDNTPAWTTVGVQLSLAENTAHVSTGVTLSLSDADGTVPELAWSSALLDVDGADGDALRAIRFSTEHTPDYETASIALLTITVLDRETENGVPRRQRGGTVTIIFDNVNERPLAISITGETIQLDVAYARELSQYFTDPDAGAVLTYGLTTAPPGATWLSVDDASGLVAGTPTAAGTWTLTASASDGQLATMASYLLVVSPNEPPSLTLIGQQTLSLVEGVVTVLVGTGQGYQVSDAEDDASGVPVTVSMTGDDRFTLDTVARELLVRASVTFDYEDANDRTLVLSLEAIDRAGARAYGELTVSLTNADDEPVVVAGVSFEVLAHNTMVSVLLAEHLVSFDAEHEEGSATLSLRSDAPSWLALDDTTLTVMPPQSAAGDRRYSLWVSDIRGREVATTITLRVLADRAPTLSVNTASATWPENSDDIALGISILGLADPDADLGDVAPTMSLVAGSPFTLIDRNLHVRPGEQQDYETAAQRTWAVGLVAVDGNAPAALGLNTTLTVTVSLMNLNDNIPEWTTVGVQLSLTENTAHVSTGVTLSISDADGTVPELQWQSALLSVAGADGDRLRAILFDPAHTPNYEASSVALLTITVLDRETENGVPRRQRYGTVTIIFDNVNERPLAVSITGETIQLDVAYARELSQYFTDPDTVAVLTYGLTTSPPGATWLSVDDASGLVAGTPTAAGTWTLTASASDGELATMASYLLVVSPNEPPSLTLIGQQTLDLVEGVVTVQVGTGQGYQVSDAEDDASGVPVTVSMTGDDRFTLDTVARELLVRASVTFDYEDPNDRTLVLSLEAIDRAGARAYGELTVSLTNKQEDPAARAGVSLAVLAHNTTVTLLDAVDLFRFEHDNEEGNTTLSLGSDSPAWLGLDRSTLAVMPSQQAAGSHMVSLWVTDSEGREGVTTITLRVLADRAPTLSVNTASATWPENSDDIALGISILGLADPDADLGDVAPTMSLVAGSPFTLIDHNLHVRPGEQQDYETAAQRTWAVGLVAVDGNAPAALGLNTTFTVTVSLTNLNDNDPDWTTVGVQLSLAENTAHVSTGVTLSISDADGTVPELQWQSALLSVAGADGDRLRAILFDPAHTPDFEASSVALLTITVLDRETENGVPRRQRGGTVTIIFAGENERPVATTITGETIQLNVAYARDLTQYFTDPDADAVLTYGLTTSPPGATWLSVGTVSGLLAGTPPAAGTWTVTASASDSLLATMASFVLVVSPNEPPSLTLLSQQTLDLVEGVITVSVGTGHAYLVSDAEDDASGVPVTVSLDGDGRFTLDTATRQVFVRASVTFDYENSNDRTLVLTLEATDRAGAQAQEVLTVSLTNAPEDPVVRAGVSLAVLAHNTFSTMLLEAQLFSFDAQYDEGTGTLTLRSDAPSWLSLQGSTLALLPPQVAAGTHLVSLWVTHGTGMAAATTLSVVVHADRAPVFTVNTLVASWPENSDGIDLGISIQGLADPDASLDDVAPSLSLLAGSPFTLEGNKLHVPVGQRQDYETAAQRSWTVGVVAVDGNAPAALGLGRTVSVTVNLANVNDNSPQWRPVGEQLPLAENTPHLSTGLTLSIWDADGTMPILSWSSNLLVLAGTDGERLRAIDFATLHTPDFEAASIALLTLTLLDQESEGGVPPRQTGGTVTVSFDNVNERPIATALANETIHVAVAYARDLSANFSDPDADAVLSFGFATSPPGATWLTVNSASGLLTGTASAPGTWTVTASASDGALATTAVYVLEVSPNNPPRLSATGQQTLTLLEGSVTAVVETGHGYEVVDVEDDANGLAVTVSLTGDSRFALDKLARKLLVRAGVAFNYETGQDRTLVLDVIATDSAGAQASVALTFSLTNVPEGPAVSAGLSVVALAHNTVVTALPAADLFELDADLVTGSETLALRSDAPPWLTSGNRSLTARPPQSAAGVHTISLWVTDSEGREAAASLTIVVPADRAPTLAVNTLAATWPENSDDIALGISILGLEDPDANLDDVAPILSLVAGSPFTVVNRQLHVPAGARQDFETAQRRSWTVGLVAVDGNAPAALRLHTTVAVTVSLANLNDNDPDWVLVGDTVALAENTAHAATGLSLSLHDADGTVPELRWSSAVLSVAGVAGDTLRAIRFSPAYTPDYEAAEFALLTITVLDRETQPGVPRRQRGGTVTVSFTNVDEPPVVASLADETVKVSVAYARALSMHFRDPEAGAALSFGLSTSPPGATWLTVGTASGLVAGTPTATGTWTVTATASDGSNQATASYVLVVSPNEPPRLTLVGRQTLALVEGTVSDEVGTGQGYLVSDTEDDASGVAVTVTLLGDGRFRLDTARQRLLVRAGETFDYEDATDRMLVLTLVATDSAGQEDQAELTVSLLNEGEGPVALSGVSLNLLAHNTALTGLNVSAMFSFDAEHEDGAETFTLKADAPSWMTVGDSTLTATPPQSSAGDHLVSLWVVDDNTGKESATSINLRVHADRAPVLSVASALVRWEENSAGIILGIGLLDYADPDVPLGDALPLLSLASHASLFTLGAGGVSVRAGQERNYETAVRRAWTLALVARDGNAPAALGLDTTVMVTVSLADVNDPVRGPGSVTDITVKVLRTLSIDLATMFTDEDAGDTLVHALSATPGAGFLALSGALATGIPLAPATHRVTASADDGNGSSATAAFRLVVLANLPPRISLSQADDTITEGQYPGGHRTRIRYQVVDDDSATTSISVQPATVFFLSGNHLHLRPGQVLDHEVNRQLRATMVADDFEGGRHTVTARIDVANANDEAPSIMRQGTPIELGEGTVAVATATGLRYVFSDADGDVLTLGLSDARFQLGADRITLVDGATVATLSLQVRADAHFDHERQPLVTLLVSVTDGVATRSDEVVFAVGDVNERPVIRQALPDLVLPVTTSFTIGFGGRFSDPEGEALAYSLSSLPVVGWMTAAETNLVGLAPAPASLAVAVTATDPAGLAVVMVFNVRFVDRDIVAEVDMVQRQVLGNIAGVITSDLGELVEARRGATQTDAGAAAALVRMLRAKAAELERGELTLQEFFAGQRVALALAGSGPGASLGFWSAGQVSRLQGGGAGLEWHGDLHSGNVGVDWQIADGLLAGVGHALSWGRFDYVDSNATSARGVFNTRIHTTFPYFVGNLTPDIEAWGLIGYGLGDADMFLDDGQGAAWSSQLDIRLFDIGFATPIQDAAGVRLRVTAGGVQLRTDRDGTILGVEHDRYHAGIGVEVDGEEWRGLRPTAHFGLRHDGGDAATGWGLGAGVRLRSANTVPGQVGTDVGVRFINQVGRLSNWGGHLLLQQGPRLGPLGYSWQLQSGWGLGEQGDLATRLDTLQAGGALPARVNPWLEANLAYGMKAGRGVLTHQLRYRREDAKNVYGYGMDYVSGSSLKFDLGTERSGAATNSWFSVMMDLRRRR